MDHNTVGPAELIRHPKEDDVLREWMECPGAGEPLEGLIASKLPLAEELNNKLDDRLRYSRVELLQQQKAFGREVGLVIDLTTGEHSCSPGDWEKNGVRYLRIPCKGKQELPVSSSVNKFVFEVMKYFYSNRPDRDTKTKYTLVHGIHGHNRTGFMIVHYLMRTRGGILSQALQAFAVARPPGIYTQMYIDSLFASYNARGCSNFMCPWRPIWRQREDIEADGEMNQLGLESKLPAFKQSAGVSLEDTLGDTIPEEYQLEMQNICYWALELPPGQGKTISPQSMPESLIRAHFDGSFLEKYYRATWKPIGPRYMLLICRDGCYLIDRDFQFRRVEMRFPRKGFSKGKTKTHHYTLLDGEMVVDTDVDSKLIRRYLVADVLMLNQEHTKNFPFHVRYQMIHDEITVPRHDDRGNAHYYYDKEPFRVRQKPFYNLSSVKNMIYDFVPKLSHPADGVLFRDWDGPYISSQHDGFLEWKFVHCIDFLVKISSSMETQPLVYLLDDEGKLKLVSVKFLGGSEPEKVGQEMDKVIKCGWHPVDKKWKVIDNTTFQRGPSSWKEYQKVLESVKRDISQPELVQAIATISKCRLYVARDQVQRR